MSISFDSIGKFFKDRAADLMRIVRGARGDVELHEVHSEAWLTADAMGEAASLHCEAQGRRPDRAHQRKNER